jgi:uncharacterized protein (DUF58 family)
MPATDPVAEADRRAVALRRLELDVTRRLDGLLLGDHQGLFHGPGTEPASGRPYQPGDDARRMDWNLTARMNQPHVRDSEPDRELETWFVVDASASLDFGTARCEKRALALAAVAAIGFLSVRGGNRTGAVLSGGARLSRFPARSGRLALLALLRNVYDQPRREGEPGVGADLVTALALVDRMHTRHGRVVVVSDFLDRTDWPTVLRRLVLRHEVLAIRVTDQRERELPAVGYLSLVDPETGRRLDVQTSSSRLRQRYAAAAAEQSAAITRALRGAGADELDLDTERDWLLDVARFVGSRRRRANALTRPTVGALR